MQIYARLLLHQEKHVSSNACDNFINQLCKITYNATAAWSTQLEILPTLLQAGDCADPYLLDAGHLSKGTWWMRMTQRSQWKGWYTRKIVPLLREHLPTAHNSSGQEPRLQSVFRCELAVKEQAVISRHHYNKWHLIKCSKETDSTLAYKTVKPIAIGKFTQVFRNGMTSAPLPGAVTTSTSCNCTAIEILPCQGGKIGQCVTKAISSWQTPLP